MQHDDGYHVLNQVRSSPAYFEQKKHKVMAMIRQLGKPTFFLTLSSAEAGWPELLKYIYKLSNGTSCSLLEAMTMSDFEKTKLIQKDPVACARYFNHKVSKLMSLLRDENGPFREHHVIDSYERIEFQNRGSSHEHIFLWLKDAPQYSENDVTSHELVISFIDKFITC